MSNSLLLIRLLAKGNNVKAVPIIQSVPNWTAINEVLDSQTSVSQLADAQSLAINDPASLPIVLARLYDWPLHSCLKIITLSIHIDPDGDDITDFLSLANFHVLPLPGKRQFHGYIATTTLDQWLIALSHGSSVKLPYHCRLLTNMIIDILRKSELMTDLRKKSRHTNKDGTYTLE
jgi:hypothetical protein